jgi:hypothetical protein
MELQNWITISALKAAVRSASRIARATRALKALGGAVDRQAYRRRFNPADVPEPLIAERYAA